MPIFEIFLRSFGKKKTINELFLDVENAFNQLLKICDKQRLPEDLISDMKKFVADKLRRLAWFKERYPNVEILGLRVWIDSTSADLLEFEETFETIEDEKKRKACIAALNKILDSLDAIEEVVPPARRTA